jgi:hypothetical protein
MSTRTDTPSRGGQIPRDLVCGLVMLAVAAFFLLNAGEVGGGGYAQYDWLFPVVLSYALGVLAVVLVLRGLLRRRALMPLVPVILRGQGVDVATVSVLTVAYVVLVNRLGFWVISPVAIFVIAVFLDTRRSLRRVALAAAVAVVTCVVAYLTLVEVFYVNFPAIPWA